MLREISREDIPYERAYLEYYLQKNVYFCSPSELGEQCPRKVLIDLEIARNEADAKNILANRSRVEAESASRIRNLKNSLKNG